MTMSNTPVLLPDGTPFPFWDDTTSYRRVYHVAAENPIADDAGPGTAEKPWATIGRAAQALQPGEKVVIHGGVYRERVRPARGGTGPDAMIAYEAAPGETVSIRGSEAWAPAFEPSLEWNWGALPESTTVWAGDMPADWFVGYNPFMAMNFPTEFGTFVDDWTPVEVKTFMLRRGMLFYNGQLLKQVFSCRQLAESDGTFWVADPGLRLYFRLPGDADPRGATLEVTTREQCFAPTEPKLGYIRVSGLTTEYGANVFPVPQRGLISASRGHHWIIEDNTVRWANATAIDIGNESWHRWRRPPGAPDEAGQAAGRHIIRRNQITDCGICGIAGVGNNSFSLIEENVIERIGWHNIERVWETGGLKFHTCDSALFRRNVFRHISHAPGLWLDVLNKNCRMTENVFADINSIKGALYLEMCYDRNLIDHNIFWDIRGDYDPDRPWSDIFEKPGFAINIDTGEQCVIAHNLFGQVPDSYTVWINLDQNHRVMAGRYGLCRSHRVLNNVFVGCPQRILFGRADDNLAEGNLYDAAEDFTSFCIEYPAPKAVLNLFAWQTYYGQDKQATQGRITASFDADTLALELAVEGALPAAAPVPELFEAQSATPGPCKLEGGRCKAQWSVGAGPRR
jgi:hypothetical protein